MKAVKRPAGVFAAGRFPFFAVLAAGLVVFRLVCGPVLFAQDTDGFGFGFAGEEAPLSPPGGAENARNNPLTVKASGEVSGGLLLYNRAAAGKEDFSFWEAGSVGGKLNTAVTSPWADGFLKLRFDTDKLLLVDEAYGRFAAGPFEAELGLRKLTWGRADSFGPLDVVNPVDYSDLTAMNDIPGMKIARPLVRLMWRFGSLSRLEGVFVPWFRGNAYALGGRWAPAQVAGMAPSLAAVLEAVAGPGVAGTWLAGFDINGFYRDSYPWDTLQYAQGGLRFTTTLGSSDLGVQYFFGRLPRPALGVDIQGFIMGGADNSKITLAYNPYHHIGADYAGVVGGFNLRAEAGANITADLGGDDYAVYNPTLIYSLGFDRDMAWGINVNLQGNGGLRLMHDKIGKDPATVDTEAGKDQTFTRITAVVSKKFFRDELELKAAALRGIEDRDFLVMPAVVWSKNDFRAEIAGGFFGGDSAGELGQYADNGYIKTVFSWRF